MYIYIYYVYYYTTIRIYYTSIYTPSIHPSQVGVFMDQSLDDVSATALAVELDVVQLHGGEDAKFVEELQKRLPEAWWEKSERFSLEISLMNGDINGDINGD